MPTKGFPYAGRACGCGARAAKHRRSPMLIGFFAVCGAGLSGALLSAKARLLAPPDNRILSYPPKADEGRAKIGETEPIGFTLQAISQMVSGGASVLASHGFPAFSAREDARPTWLDL